MLFSTIFNILCARDTSTSRLRILDDSIKKRVAAIMQPLSLSWFQRHRRLAVVCHRIQLVIPSVVARAVSMLIRICRTVFQVSFFIVFIFFSFGEFQEFRSFRSCRQ